MESTKSTAYAFMVMLAGLAVIAHYGRASAEVGYAGAPQQQAMAAAYPNMGGAGMYAQYGLIQTGAVGISTLDANGGFGRPSVMPVFQVIQMQPAAGLVARQAAAAPNLMGGQQQQTAPEGMAAAPAEQAVPQGMTVTSPAPTQGTLCDVNGVRVLTQSPDACTAAGGRMSVL